MTDEAANQTQPAAAAQPSDAEPWSGVFDVIECLFSMIALFL